MGPLCLHYSACSIRTLVPVDGCYGFYFWCSLDISSGVLDIRLLWSSHADNRLFAGWKIRGRFLLLVLSIWLAYFHRRTDSYGRREPTRKGDLLSCPPASNNTVRHTAAPRVPRLWCNRRICLSHGGSGRILSQVVWVYDFTHADRCLLHCSGNRLQA